MIVIEPKATTLCTDSAIAGYNVWMELDEVDIKTDRCMMQHAKVGTCR